MIRTLSYWRIVQLFCTQKIDPIVSNQGGKVNPSVGQISKAIQNSQDMKVKPQFASLKNNSEQMTSLASKKQAIENSANTIFSQNKGESKNCDYPKEEGPIQMNVTNHQFIVGPKNGFLPVDDPIFELPNQFAALQSILQRMPLKTAKGQNGLLTEGKLGDTVHNKLPLYDVTNVNDGALLSALFRDYTILASGYLLQNCDIQWKKTQSYGLGRGVLPKNIAVPLAHVAKKINAKPYLQYALSHALYNYKKIDRNGPFVFDNLDLIRSFSGSRYERGFVLVHVTMVNKSKELVSQTINILNAAQTKDRTTFDAALIALRKNLHQINEQMDTMWSRSNNKQFNNFRTFMMGIFNQPMFPKGVIYEGVSDEPQFYRGSSGATDAMIPTIDSLMGLRDLMPDNPLTRILRDFDSYRPANHIKWIEDVYQKAITYGVRNFAVENTNSAVLYMAILDQVRDFRHRHWNFMKEYVLKFSKHSVATGGSPVVTFLPNQISVVLKTINELSKTVDKSKLSHQIAELMTTITQRSEAQAKILKREVQNLKKEYPDQEF